MYIYKLGTECDGAQMRVSDVYIATLVALLGLCFDPSECFRDLRVWSGVVGNKSSKLWYVSRIVTEKHNDVQSYQKIQLTIKRDMTQTQILVSMMQLRREQVRARARARVKVGGRMVVVKQKDIMQHF